VVRRVVKVVNNVGLHARPAAAFVKAASGFPCHIQIETELGHADAKSLLMVLALGVVQGAQIAIVADGPDEERAVGLLVELVESGFPQCS
jgi:phosphocarrier protein HPr